MFVVVKKRTIIKVLAVLLVIAALCAVALTFAQSATVEAFGKSKLLPIYYVDRTDGKVALSFDAAWGADKTGDILDILDSYNVKATFFLVGFWIDKYPEVVKEIDRRGHAIGNHSTNHLHAKKLTKAEMLTELELTNQKLVALLNKEVRFYRPPFGEYNDNLIETVEGLGMQAVQWSIDSLDWQGLSAAQIADRVLPKVKSGSVVLFHNNADNIVAALKLVLFGLKTKGLTAVRMDELIYDKDYVIATDGAQRKKT